MIPSDTATYYLNTAVFFSTESFGEKVLDYWPKDSIEISPQIWGKQVLDQLSGLKLDIMSKIKSNLRTMIPYYQVKEFTFSNISRVYDAFKEDIAVVNDYFSTSTVMVYSTRINKTWIDFISGFGGNVGLFIGFSFVTIFELFWLFVRMVKLYF